MKSGGKSDHSCSAKSHFFKKKLANKSFFPSISTSVKSAFRYKLLVLSNSLKFSPENMEELPIKPPKPKELAISDNPPPLEPSLSKIKTISELWAKLLLR